MLRSSRRLCVVALAVVGWLPLVLLQGGVASAAPPPTVLPAPPTVKNSHPTLESPLGQIVDKLGTRPAPELAASAPLSRDDAVAVTIRFTNPARVSPVADYLRDNGGAIANTGTDFLEAYVPVAELDATSMQDGVGSVAPIVPPSTRPGTAITSLARGRVTSQGTTLHNAPNWNAAGYTGSGVKVGIIDVGFGGYSALIGNEVPAPAGVHCYTAAGAFTTNLADCDAADPHGTAVAETLADIAPGATLYLADPVTVADARNVVAWMVSQGVRVINLSENAEEYYGPGDGTSPLPDNPYAYIDAAVAGGIVWINSTGNDASASWIGPYSGNVGSFLNFGGAGTTANYITLAAGQRYAIRARWDDSWAAAATNIDLYLFRWDGSSYTPVAGSTNLQNGQGGRTPREFIEYIPSTTGIYAVGLYHVSGKAPSFLQVQISNWDQEFHFFERAYSIATPADSASPGELAVGATTYQDTATIDPMSGQGPTIDNRMKPDVVGVDCAATATDPAFCGTSQAAPHVAGLAALALQRFPSFTPQQVANYLRTNALPRGTPVPNEVWGGGLAFAPMSVSGIQPPSTYVTGGVPIQIVGIGIGSTTTVTVAGHPCTSVTLVSGTTLRCMVPSGTAGTADVVLRTNGATLTVRNAFSYLPPDALPGQRPTGGVAGSNPPSPLPGQRPGGSLGGQPPSIPSPRP
jgi:subtilisin family serine protease